MNRSNFTKLLKVSAVLLLGAIAEARRVPRCHLMCNIWEALLYNPCCNGGFPWGERRSGLCEPCGGSTNIQCLPGFYCRLENNLYGGKCIPITYAGPGIDYRQDGDICDFCSIHNFGKLCGPGLACVEKDSSPDSDGICLPQNGPVYPPNRRNICEPCGGLNGAGCNYGLDCKTIDWNSGICLPVDGYGSDTYGQEGGVCGTCVPNADDSQCQVGLNCQYTGGYGGICVTDNGSWKCDPRKGEEFTECGTACPDTCDNYNVTRPCITLCIPGCFCPTGKVRRGFDDRCVDPKECWRK